MFRLIKWLFYLAVLGAAALAVYAYLGPFLGADFSPSRGEVRHDVILETQ